MKDYQNSLGTTSKVAYPPTVEVDDRETIALRSAVIAADENVMRATKRRNDVVQKVSNRLVAEAKFEKKRVESELKYGTKRQAEAYRVLNDREHILNQAQNILAKFETQHRDLVGFGMELKANKSPLKSLINRLTVFQGILGSNKEARKRVVHALGVLRNRSIARKPQK